MRILVIDDQRIFKSFPSLPEPGEADDIQQYDTDYKGVMALILRPPWDEVYLDHDLGMNSHGSGSDIVDKIEEVIEAGGGVDVGKFYIITMNPAGGNYMMKVLGKYFEVEWIDPTPYLDFEKMYSKGKDPFLAGPRR